VTYLQWISETQLAIVTRTKVYHWTLDAAWLASQPDEIFALEGALVGRPVLSYSFMEDGQWALLTTAAKRLDVRAGDKLVQVVNLQRRERRVFTAQAAALERIDGVPHLLQLFADLAGVTMRRLELVHSNGRDWLRELPHALHANQTLAIPPPRLDAVSTILPGRGGVAIVLHADHLLVYDLRLRAWVYDEWLRWHAITAEAAEGDVTIVTRDLEVHVCRMGDVESSRVVMRRNTLGYDRDCAS
jgi:hypothetical protein